LIGCSTIRRWILLTGVVTLMGCPKAAPQDPTRVHARRAVVPSDETVIAVEGFLRPYPKPLRLLEMPPFPRFRDPYGLPRRSLQKERNLAYRRRGRKRQLLLTHIAARLWRLANRKIDLIRGLIAAAKAEGRPPRRDRIDRLQRKVSAHLRECVTLLEGVLETKQPPEMARVRLAHYLRKLKPMASAKLFERLLVDTRDLRRRTAYALDLAQLWVWLGRPAAAGKVLRADAEKARGARPALLGALALARSDGSPRRLEAELKRLFSAVHSASAALRQSAVHHLPALLSRVLDPARLLAHWKRVDAVGFGTHGPTVSALLVQQLMDRGSLRAARDVLRWASGAGGAPSAALRARVLRLAGPWKVRAAPPPVVSWTAHMRARVPAVARCFLSVGADLRAWKLELLIPPDGTVREVKGGPFSGPWRLGSIRGATPALPRGLGRCIGRIVRGWHFPPWRAARSVRLTATLRLGDATL